jgi:TonB family protein
MREVSGAAKQGDRLLWMLGGGVGLVAVLSFVMLNFGTTEESAREQSTSLVTTAKLKSAEDHLSPEVPSDDLFRVRLNRAQLAFDAGMLIEPEGFSAWSLYEKILAEDAGNRAAQRGLEAVADALVDEASEASSAGQDAAAQRLLALVLKRYPEHEEAANLRDRMRQPVAASAPPQAVVAERRSAPAAPSRARGEAAPQERPSEPPTVAVSVLRANPVAALYPNFTRALADGRLIEPATESAEHFLAEMRQLDADHAMTQDAEQQLLEAMLQRHGAAFDLLDTQGALTWLDAADRLDVDAGRVAAAREDVFNFLEAAAAVESIAASELKVVNYTPPTYPDAAARRGIEGWVEVEFLVGKDGIPYDVTIIDASHDNFFRNEAISAVSAWSFEPRSVMNHVVEQRAHTRIRFVLAQ